MKRVLVVEDNPADAILAVEAFSEGEIKPRVDVVADGEQALRYLRREGEYSDHGRPDLVLLDLHMPGKSGQEVLRAARDDDELQSIPMVVLSSSAADAEVKRAYDAGARAYVRKDVDFEAFVKRIRLLERFWFDVANLPVSQPARAS